MEKNQSTESSSELIAKKTWAKPDITLIPIEKESLGIPHFLAAS